MDCPNEEPLNLTVRKMPIAIVAPFSRTEPLEKTNPETNNNNEHDFPQDLSVKNREEQSSCLDLTKNTNQQLRNYLLKGQEEAANNIYNRNVYSPLDTKDKPLENPDLYNKLLAAWYVNSIIRQSHHNPYLSFSASERSSPFETKSNSPSSNRILNNLLEKKPFTSYTFPSGFDALIKNEMQNDETFEKSSFTKNNNNNNGSQDHKNNVDVKNNQDNEKKKPHIKKPLNAFMLYMKEMRAKVVAECTLKESAAINQILGRRWHALGREEQAKYYELARRERQLHMQLYPDWSSRANATRGKKRKRKQDPQDGGNSMKKCRARYGLDQQSQWCKPCSPENGTGGATAPIQGGLLHIGGPASAQTSQEPTYVNL
ncbi:hypothetical protein ABEB36_001326 [Hypothenemus hampei]|uniref:dTCF n=1 Tax=Hypothenemus hampei TaxID=57062 RepID=A0ABD1FGQ7_HYPHA